LLPGPLTGDIKMRYAVTIDNS